MEYTLESLPEEVDEAIIVVGYLGAAIKEHFGTVWQGIKLKYAESDLGGTAIAMQAAEPHLKDGSFLVVFGDDLRNKADLEKISKEKIAFGLYKGVPNHLGYWNILVDDSGYISGANLPSEREIQSGINVATGVFMLDRRIFNYEPVKITGGEYGLPQTILNMARNVPLKAVFMERWFPITNPEDLFKAEKFILDKVYKGG